MSSTSSCLRLERKRASVVVASAGSPGRNRKAAQTVEATSRGSNTSVRSTITTPSAYWGLSPAASSAARRVFPVPAGPVSVTSRAGLSGTRCRSRTSSDVRPTNVVTPGRLVRRWRTASGRWEASSGSASVRVGGRRPSAEVQGRVVPQDRIVEVAQRFGRLHAQLIDQGAAAVPKDPEGIDLSA